MHDTYLLTYLLTVRCLQVFSARQVHLESKDWQARLVIQVLRVIVVCKASEVLLAFRVSQETRACLAVPGSREVRA